jgi:hypothetical protein
MIDNLVADWAVGLLPAVACGWLPPTQIGWLILLDTLL